MDKLAKVLVLISLISATAQVIGSVPPATNTSNARPALESTTPQLTPSLGISSSGQENSSANEKKIPHGTISVVHATDRATNATSPSDQKDIHDTPSTTNNTLKLWPGAPEYNTTSTDESSAPAITNKSTNFSNASIMTGSSPFAKNGSSVPSESLSLPLKNEATSVNATSSASNKTAPAYDDQAYNIASVSNNNTFPTGDGVANSLASDGSSNSTDDKSVYPIITTSGMANSTDLGPGPTNTTTYTASSVNNGTYAAEKSSSLNSTTSTDGTVSHRNVTLASVHSTHPMGSTNSTYRSSSSPESNSTTIALSNITHNQDNSTTKTNESKTNETSSGIPTVVTGSVRTFVVSASITWSQTDVNFYDNSGPIAYVITTNSTGVPLTADDIVVKEYSNGEKKLRIDAYAGKCGKKTEWSADDGTKILIDPRGPLSDRWYIRNANFPSPEYTFRRHAMSLGGNIVDSKSKRTVATITKEKLKSVLPNLPFRKGSEVFIITNDGIIPDWDLITMLAVGAHHYKKCKL